MPVSLSPSALLFARLSSMAALGDHEWSKLRSLDQRRPEVWRPNTCLPVREREPETAYLIIAAGRGAFARFAMDAGRSSTSFYPEILSKCLMQPRPEPGPRSALSHCSAPSRRTIS